MPDSNAPLVSVIITNYNYARFLGQCIDSVCAQTYGNLDIVVVDDGSTDESREVARHKEGEDTRVRLVARANEAQAAALNTGFTASAGELVAFMDSDDYWMPEKIATVVPLLMEGRYSVVQHNLAVVDAQGAPTGEVHPGVQFTGNALKAYFAENHTSFFSTASGMACRRKDLEKIFPLDEDWRICADVPLRTPLPLFGDILTVPQPLGFYRVHGDNKWMLSEGQEDAIANGIKYAEYANRVLAAFGEKRQMDFRRSQVFREWELRQLPVYHPRRLWAGAGSVLRLLCPAPLKKGARALAKHVSKGP